jgi:hypothetical protein
MRTVVATFVYPGAEKWTPFWIQSLKAQTDSDFETVVFEDRCNFASHFLSLSKTTTEHFDAVQTPYEVRISALAFLKKHYPDSLLIFSDIDDLSSRDRVQKSKLFFQNSKAQILIANLSLVDANGTLTSPALWTGRLPKTFDESFILDSNIAGFGNTALLSNAIPADLEPYRASVVAGDWFFFYCLLKDTKLNAQTTDDPLVLYRQHASNEAGISKLTEDRLFHGIEVILAHFNALNKRYPGEGYDLEVKQTNELKDFIQNPENRLKYLSKVNQTKTPHTFWWEDIRPLSGEQNEH